MGNTGARTWDAVARGAFGIGDALMQIGSRHEKEAAEKAAAAHQLGREKIEDQRYDADRRHQLESEGYAVDDTDSTSLGKTLIRLSPTMGVPAPPFMVGKRDPAKTFANQDRQAARKAEMDDIIAQAGNAVAGMANGSNAGSTPGISYYTARPEVRAMIDRNAQDKAWAIIAKFGPDKAGAYKAVGELSGPEAQGARILVHQKYGEPTLAAADRDGGRAGAGAEAPINALDQRTMDGNNAIISDIDDAMVKLKAHPEAIGARGMLPDVALKYFDPEGVEARATLANVTSQIMLMRSGGAVSDGEFARLQPFLAQDTDNAQMALTKLRNIRAQFERRNATIGGGAVPVQPGPVAQQVPPGTAPPAARGDSFRNRYGK